MKNNYFKNKVIILTSDEPWSEMMHTQLLFALELSKLCKIIYVNPPGKWSFNCIFGFKSKIKKVSEGLYVFDYKNVFPLMLFRTFILKLNDGINFYLLSKQAAKDKLKIILWRFDCFRLVFVKFIKPEYKIYHCVDNYQKMPFNDFLSKASDLVIVTSPRLFEFYKAFNKHTIVIPQGISDSEFDTDRELINNISNRHGDFVIFTGTLSGMIDFELLHSIARSFTNVNLVLIGPEKLSEKKDIANWNSLRELNNVHYLGLLAGNTLKNYIKAARACIIPYKKNPAAEHSVIRSPLKAINYIAQMKPVISTSDCEIDQLHNKVIYTAGTHEEFILFVRKALNNALVVDEKEIMKYLSSIRYDVLIHNIAGEMNIPNQN